MATRKHNLIAVVGTLSAALTLSACGGVGYDSSYGSDQQPAAANVENAAPEPPAGGLEPAAGAEGQEPAAGGEEPAAGEDEEVSAAAAPRPAAPRLSADRATERLIAKTVRKMGAVVTDEKGWILYRFDKDKSKPPTSNCEGECARIWPPVLTTGEPALTGVNPRRVGTILRADGTRQVTLGGWPLYRYVGDKKPGQWKGQGVGGTWFVAAPTGARNRTCLPKVPPKPAAAPAAPDDTVAEDPGGESTDPGTGGSY